MPPRKQRRKPADAALEAYRRKRNFGATPEPDDRTRGGSGSIFVVQEHHARSHHFDLRLELDGVLKSWAVPKGPSLDPAVKRLAVQVEDHPIEYATFQGIIPAGNYGAGKVEIWDAGTWEPAKPDEDPRQALEKGRLGFRLSGTKLKGGFMLARMAGGKNWLLRKSRDERVPAGGLSRRAPQRKAGDEVPVPQLSKLSAVVPKGPDWIHELKFDGYRVIARQRNGKVALVTRGGHDWTDRFGDLADRISAISPKDFMIDGEVVVLDSRGRSDFGRLQEALKSGKSRELVFAAFDLLDLDGKDIAPLPLLRRKEMLRDLMPENDKRLMFSRHWTGSDEGRQLFEQACRLNLEGIISKEAKQPYLPGSRQSWRKVKCVARQEFVICGYTPPKGSCPGFGALVMGSFENGRLVPRGKVGTGFGDKQRMEILAELEERRLSKPPFEDGGVGEDVTWVRPDLVAEVKFSELTRDGFIRHGSFLGLREDKRAKDVSLESEPGVTMEDEPSDNGNKVRGIAISNPNREIYPGTGITKLDVARYYDRVADWMLPYLAKRPLAFLRAPTGITGQIFFQKHFAAHLPKGVKMKSLADDDERVCHISDPTALLSLVQFGVLEFHPWGSPLSRPDKPDTLIWDLDPEPSVPWREVLGAAFLLRDLLTGCGLHPVVKTSGGKGLHVMVFCKPKWTWDRLKPFTRSVSEELRDLNPKRFTVQLSKAKRTGRIFIDWLRNGRGATCVAPWSLRARGNGPISLPLDWSALPEATPDGATLRNAELRLPAEWETAKSAPDDIPAALLKKFGV